MSNNHVIPAQAGIQKKKYAYGLNVFFTDKDVPDVSSYAPGAQKTQTVHLPAVIPEHPVIPAKAGIQKNKKENTILIKDLADDHSKFGLSVRIPKNFIATSPLIIDTDAAEAARFDRLVVHAEEGSEIVVIERVKSSFAGAIRTSSVHVVLGAGAKVTHVAVQDMEEDAAEFVDRTSEVGKDASMIWTASITGGAFTKNHSHTKLVGEGAAVKSRTLFFGDRTQKFDVYAEAEHLAPRTHADLAGRGALMDAAKAIARGMVRIPTGSKKSTASEREDVLVFGAKAEADVIPNLEIAEGDVRCSHGAAIGRIDEEKIFYLMSRGLDRRAATSFAVEGFFAPMFEDMHHDGLRDAVECLIAEKIATAFASPDEKR